jgi:YVTN family beta-propeller protein
MRPLLALVLALFACAPAETAQPAAESGGAGTLLVGNKGEHTLSFIDLVTGRELGRAATGNMPHEIAISPDGRLIATTERSRSLTIVDTRSDDAVSQVRTDQEGTHMVAVTPDGRRAFTANIGSGTVSVIDLAEGRKLRDIAVGGQPEGIALTPDGRELWVGDLQGARVQAFDAASFERLAEVRTGDVPIRVVASPDGRWIVTSNVGDGSLTVIDRSAREVARTIRVSGTQEAAQVTILFSADGRRIYAAETGRSEVAEVDFEQGTVLRRIPVGRQGDGLALAP